MVLLGILRRPVYNRGLRRIPRRTMKLDHQTLINPVALSTVLALILSACGGAALPQDKLTAAKAAVRAAEVGGAADNPKAALHLKYARDNIAEASAMIEEEEHELAAALLDRAEIDAELAFELARVQSARDEAEEARAEVEELRKKQAKGK